MKKMNISHNSKHFLNVLLLIVALLGMSGNMWAATATWTGTVSVASGSGTATVEIYNDDDGKTEDTKSTTSSAVTVKYSESTSLVHWWIEKHHLIFTATPSTGYHFVKWTGDITSGDVNSTLSPYSTASRNSGQTLTLEANFALNTYTVKFEANRGTGATGTGSMSAQEFTYGTAQNLSANAFTKDGYSFVGWNTKANGTGTSYTDKQNVNNLTTENGAEITLYAQWTANTYTITLNSDLATTHGTTSIEATYDANTNLTSPIAVPSRDKWTFWGYFTGENGAGTKLIDKEGNVLASVSGFTDSNKKWKYAGNITLYAYMTEKSNQTITWDNITNGQEYATGTMGAIASSGLTVTYTYDNEEWAYINENNRLVVLVPNKTITITASQAGNDYYNAAPDVTKTFITLGANPNQLTEVTASGITYGQTLSASVLSGNVKLDGVVIPGTLSWVDAEIMPDAGTENHMALFTPENQSAYSSVYFDVPVTVAKATPVITWHITNVLHEQVRYNHFVESSNKEAGADLSFQTSNSSLLNITDDALIIGPTSEKQDGWIKVSQPETDNYNAYNETWSLRHDVTVYPKAKICLPLDLTPANGNAENDYNDARVAITKPGGWCNTNEDGYKKDYIALYDVTYTQRVGIALGSWEDGLSGIGSAIANWLAGRSAEFAYTTKSVDLFFSGIPDKISLDVESQAVTTTWPTVTWNATAKNWHVYASVDGVDYTQIASREGDGNISYTFVNENVRYVRIVYSGNFTGFVKNLRITQKKYIRSNKSELTFGTKINPLQEPQPLILNYSSLGVCGGSAEDAITITSSNPAFYVDEETITENVGVEQSGSYTIRVRCNDVNQEGMLTCTSNDGTTLSIPVHSMNPPIRTAATDIFQTGTEHAPVSGTVYRPHRKIFSAGIVEGLFEGSTPLFDTLYICGVSECAVTSREWEYSPIKNYNVPRVTATNVHTPCFVYKKDGAQYTHVRTFDAATTTLNVADSKTRVLVGYRPESPAATAVQLNAGAAVSLNNTEIVATNAAIAVNGNASVAARGANIVSSASNAAVQLSGATTLGIEDNWKSGEASAVLALRPAAGYPSIDLGSANGRVDINGTQLELHNATNMAIAHMDGTTEKFDGEVHINDGSVVGDAILGMPKLTFIDGGTFNDGTIAAYTLKGIAKRPRNSRGEIVSRQTMAPAALAAGYSWYGQDHLTPDEAAKVNPMLMDEEVWIFNGANSENSDDPTSWNKGAGLPGEDDDVLINAPMVISGGELKVKSLTINWEDKGKGIPAVTVNPDGGLTVGEGGIDGIKVNMVNNLALKAGAEGATKGQTGFLRIHPNSAEPMPEATVELYSIGYYDYNDKAENIAKWQYVGSPLASSDVLAKTVYKKSWVYAWDEAANEWSNKRSTYTLTPFAGFATTQRTYADGMMLTYTGQIVSSETNVNIPLSYSGKGHGENVLANSFVAPIDITKFEDEDFKNIDSTVYLFNTGSRTDEEAAKETKDINTPGQYLAIPIGTARLLKGTFGLPTVIAPMQGFCVHAIKEDAEIKLNYEKLVWNGNYVENANTPLRVKAYYSEEDSENVGALRISLKANGWMDHLFMIESEQFNTKYEGGYDARKRMGDELNIFAVENNDQLSVDATNSIIGTRVGVRTGEETMYTMFFSHLNSEKELALLDWETEQITEITENAEYTFFAEPNSMITDRFEIIEWDGSNKPGIATGVENVENGTKVHKFIKDNQLFILKNGVLYNATGVLVR